MTNLSSVLSKLSDSELFERTDEVAKREKETTIELLYHLHEVEGRKLFAARGFTSLWEYVTKHLGYSETQTAERISAMRLIFRVQEARNALEAGRINVTQAAMTERHLRAEEKEKGTAVPKEEIRQLISEVQGLTKRETEKLLISLKPQEPIVQEKIKPVTEDISELKFPISEDVRKAMERYWEIRGKCSISELFSACLEFYLSQKDPMRVEKMKKQEGQEAKAVWKENLGNVQIFPKFLSDEPESLPLPVKVKPRSRYISTSVRREVQQRSQGRCEYVDAVTGRRCESRHLLQFDHIDPLFFGGPSDLDNIRALCSTHNRYLAKKMFACEPVERYATPSI